MTWMLRRPKRARNAESEIFPTMPSTSFKNALSWLRKGDPEVSAFDLQRQLEGAQAAKEAACDATVAALERFDSLGDDESARALERCRSLELLAADHVDRAQRHIIRREQETEAREFAVLQSKAARLQASLTSAALDERRKATSEAEVELLLQLVDVRGQRFEIEAEINADRVALHNMREALTGEPAGYLATEPPVAPVRKALSSLTSLIARLDRNDPRRAIANSLADELAPSRHRFGDRSRAAE